MSGNWTYSDWITYADDSLRLERLRLHIQEVSNAVGRENQVGDFATSSRENRMYLDRLLTEERSLGERISALGGSDGIPTHTSVVF